MFKDKEKQKEANRLAKQRQRLKIEPKTAIVENQAKNEVLKTHQNCAGDAIDVIPYVSHTLNVIPFNVIDNCQCKHCQQVRINKSDAKLNHGQYMSASELALNGYTHNRVSLPGDVDYTGVCNA